MHNLTPAQIVTELDKYIVGQNAAKKAVAIALRNRWRRAHVSSDLKEEIYPKNILMMGPTGVGKTEIARRLAKLVEAPFLKVEATKYTEVGYVGKDVESMIRDLLEISITMVKASERERLYSRIQENVEDRLLDLLMKKNFGVSAELGDGGAEPVVSDSEDIRKKDLRQKLREGLLEEERVRFETKEKPQAVVEVLAVPGMEEMENSLRDLLGNMLPKKSQNREMSIKDARRLVEDEVLQKKLDMSRVVSLAIQKVEESGIVFLDEMDKIAETRDQFRSGAHISREGVQRDLLPIVEGARVHTKHGMVRTDHILFIGAGAFHLSKPSDLMPELQGRFPIRVELSSLTTSDFERILVEPKNSLLRQYEALLKAERVELIFSPGSIRRVCELATQVNESSENIGARRLHTVLERVLEDVSFNAADLCGGKFEVTAEYVDGKVKGLVENQDLTRYIL